MGMRRQAALRTGVAIRLQLFGFHAHVAKLSKVLIKGRDWYVLSHRGGGEQTIDKTDLDARVGNEAPNRKSDISAGAQPQWRLRGFQRKTFLFPFCWQAHP